VIVGILSDTHDEIERTREAVRVLCDRGSEAIIHCGDIYGYEIIAACAVLPLYFTFGNRDCDMVPVLRKAAEQHRAVCLGWGGEVTLADKRLAIVHGHMTMDLRPLLNRKPDYLFSGHSHIAGDWYEGPTRRINPGALAEADEYSVALLDLKTDQLEFIRVP
jgi:putative phosphoesterase